VSAEGGYVELPAGGEPPAGAARSHGVGQAAVVGRQALEVLLSQLGPSGRGWLLRALQAGVVPPGGAPGIYSVRGTAQVLGVSAVTVDRAIRAGFPAVRIQEGRYMVEAAVIRAMEQAVADLDACGDEDVTSSVGCRRSARGEEAAYPGVHWVTDEYQVIRDAWLQEREERRRVARRVERVVRLGRKYGLAPRL